MIEAKAGPDHRGVRGQGRPDREPGQCGRSLHPTDLLNWSAIAVQRDGPVRHRQAAVELWLRRGSFRGALRVSGVRRMKPAGRARHRCFQLLAATILTISWALPGCWPYRRNSAAVRVTSGEHPGFGRVVLDAPGLAYTVNRDGGHLVIRFPDDPALGELPPTPHNGPGDPGSHRRGGIDRAARRRCSHVADWRQGHRGHQRPGAGSSAGSIDAGPRRREWRQRGERGETRGTAAGAKRRHPAAAEPTHRESTHRQPTHRQPIHRRLGRPINPDHRPAPVQGSRGTSKPAEPAAGWNRSESAGKGTSNPDWPIRTQDGATVPPHPGTGRPEAAGADRNGPVSHVTGPDTAATRATEAPASESPVGSHIPDGEGAGPAPPAKAAVATAIRVRWPLRRTTARTRGRMVSRERSPRRHRIPRRPGRSRGPPCRRVRSLWSPAKRDRPADWRAWRCSCRFRDR